MEKAAGLLPQIQSCVRDCADLRGGGDGADFGGPGSAVPHDGRGHRRDCAGYGKTGWNHQERGDLSGRGCGGGRGHDFGTRPACHDGRSVRTGWGGCAGRAGSAGRAAGFCI